MATVLKAGNVTTGGSFTPDSTGTMQIKTGTGAGTTAITIDASQNVTFTNSVIRSGTAVASTSGTSIDFTSLPTGIKRITVMLNGVSTNGTSIIQVQLGDSGGIETTGYLTSVWQANTNNANVTTGFALGAGALAINTLSGHVVFTLLGSNIWVGSGVIARTDAADSRILGGNKSLSDVLDRVRITTVNGTDTFDAGSINILYE